MIRQRHILLFCFILISSTWIACKRERDPCLQPTTIPLRFGTYRSADTGSVGVDSSLANALVGLVDTPFSYQFKGTSKFSIFLSPKKKSLQWYIIPDSSQWANPFQRDTVTFFYEPKLHFLSEGCGFVYFYNLTNVATTHYVIDSLIIKNYDVTTEANIEHVKIFY